MISSVSGSLAPGNLARAAGVKPSSLPHRCISVCVSRRIETSGLRIHPCGVAMMSPSSFSVFSIVQHLAHATTIRSSTDKSAPLKSLGVPRRDCYPQAGRKSTCEVSSGDGRGGFLRSVVGALRVGFQNLMLATLGKITAVRGLAQSTETPEAFADLILVELPQMSIAYVVQTNADEQRQCKEHKAPGPIIADPGKKEIGAKSADSEQSNGQAVVECRPKYDLCLAGFFHAPKHITKTLRRMD